MKLQKKIKALAGFVKRGFRYEKFDFTKIEQNLGMLDYCAVLRLVPMGFHWKSVRMVVGGPISATGTLELFSRHVRTEQAHRYTVNFEGKPTTDDGVVSFALPLATESANIGVVGIYYTNDDGTQGRYIARRPATVQRGHIVNIQVPPPIIGKENGGRAYIKPEVEELTGEKRENVLMQMQQ